MYKFFLKSIFIVFFVNISTGQKDIKSLNCVILFDDVLVDGLTGVFEIIDEDESIIKIEFGYEIGEIRMAMKDYDVLQSVKDHTKINMNMIYKTFDNGINNTYTFTKQIEAVDLKQRYLKLGVYSCKKFNTYKVFKATPRYSNAFPEPINKGKLLKCD